MRIAPSGSSRELDDLTRTFNELIGSLAEAEAQTQAAYTGAIGRIGFDGRVALSVAIRIVEKHGEDVWFQTGGGIVADSDPAREYEETLVKAAGIVRALGVDLTA